MRRTAAFTSTLLLFILLAFGPSPIPAQGTDAHLIGEWVGKWVGNLAQGTGISPAPTPRGVTNSGDYRLTITNVEDGKVYGRVQHSLLTVPEVKLVGTLNQNILSFGSERYQTQLTIAGDRMDGTLHGAAVPLQISLQKKK